MNKKKLTLLGSLIIVLIILGTIGYNFVNSKKLVVEFSNVQEVYLIEKIAYETDKSSAKKSTVKKSGQTKRIPGNEYVLLYKGADGYANGTIPVDLRSADQKISINPFYSETRLASDLDQERASITETLKKQINKIDLYNPELGKLHEFGQWYSTTLLYDGNDEYNADTLRLVMKKENGNWTLVTDPPQIIISKNTYPDIPLHILNDVNNDQKPKLQFKYTGE